MIICENCSHDYDGNFCPNCGQKASIQRITLQYLWRSSLHIILDYDRGLWPTLRDLFVRPGTLITNYLEGQRVRYYQPFKLLLVLAAIGAFITLQSGAFSAETFLETIPEDERQSELALIFADVLQAFGRFFTVFMFLSVPAYALFSWLFYRKNRYNFTEHLFLMGYYVCFTTILYVLFTPIMFFPPPPAIRAGLGLFVLLYVIFYQTWVLKVVFQQSWLRTIWKGVLIYFLGAVTYLLILVFLAGVYVGFRMAASQDQAAHLEPFCLFYG